MRRHGEGQQDKFGGGGGKRLKVGIGANTACPSALTKNWPIFLAFGRFGSALSPHMNIVNAWFWQVQGS